MAEPMMMNGATDSPLSLLSPEAREGMMRPSEEIKAVLLARLGNMAPEELSMLDQAITPAVAQVLVRLLPELREIVEQVGAQESAPEQEAPMQGGEQMGALSGM
tara:strand:+ start:526 stop:837 length:312 start_codon:yes stop_codon:yes gene_type:complete